MPSCTGKPNSFWPLVGDDARAERRARGYSFAALMVDEATLLPDSLLHTLLDRLSVPGARAVMTCNPLTRTTRSSAATSTSPARARFSRVLPRRQPIAGRGVQGRAGRARYQGGEHRRMVLGEWAAMEGQIWPSRADRPGVWCTTSGGQDGVLARG